MNGPGLGGIMKTKLGFIGLGEMGLPMAKNLAGKGYPLSVYDVDPEPLRQLTELGAVAAAGPDAVAEYADFVMIIVRTTDQVRNVIFGANGIATAASPPSAVAVMSTISPLDAREMAAKANEKGIGFIDAPVSGARLRAELGELTIMVGGDTGIFKEFSDVLEVLGRYVVHVGDVGAGQTVKLINNMLLLINMCGAHEAKALVDAAGLDLKTVFDIVRVSTGKSWVVDNWETVDGWKTNYVSGGTLDIVYKDIDTTLYLGEKKRVPLYLSALAKQMVRY